MDVALRRPMPRPSRSSCCPEEPRFPPGRPSPNPCEPPRGARCGACCGEEHHDESNTKRGHGQCSADPTAVQRPLGVGPRDRERQCRHGPVDQRTDRTGVRRAEEPDVPGTSPQRQGHPPSGQTGEPLRPAERADRAQVELLVGEHDPAPTRREGQRRCDDHQECHDGHSMRLVLLESPCFLRSRIRPGSRIRPDQNPASRSTTPTSSSPATKRRMFSSTRLENVGAAISGVLALCGVMMQLSIAQSG